MPGERKSVEPMAAVVAPSRVSAKHQSLLHLVGQAPWSDEAVLRRVREWVVPSIERQGDRIEAWIVDDTGFAKKGTHSVGVARQYCGRLGKQDNCQIAVTLSIANHAASLPIAYRLYLPDEWAKDQARRKKAKVPKEGEVQDQAADCARSDPYGLCRGRRPRHRTGGRRLWRGSEISHRRQRSRPPLCRRHPIDAQRLAARQRTFTTEEMDGPRPQTDQAAAR